MGGKLSHTFSFVNDAGEQIIINKQVLPLLLYATNDTLDFIGEIKKEFEIKDALKKINHVVTFKGQMVKTVINSCMSIQEVRKLTQIQKQHMSSPPSSMSAFVSIAQKKINVTENVLRILRECPDMIDDKSGPRLSRILENVLISLNMPLTTQVTNVEILFNFSKKQINVIQKNPSIRYIRSIINLDSPGMILPDYVFNNTNMTLPCSSKSPFTSKYSSNVYGISWSLIWKILIVLFIIKCFFFQ